MDVHASVNLDVVVGIDVCSNGLKGGPWCFGLFNVLFFLIVRLFRVSSCFFFFSVFNGFRLIEC